MDDVDWRIKLSGTIKEGTIVPWNKHIIKKGDRVKLVSVIDLPKKRTLTIPVPELVAIYINSSAKSWNEYQSLRNENKIITSLKSDVSFSDDKAAFDAIEAIAVSVITAYNAIEAFSNDSIPDNHEFWHHKRSEIILEKTDKKEIERYYSTANKLNNILPDIYGVGSPKGISPIWVSYKKLKECRDGLVHAKSHEVRSVGSGKENLWDKLFKIKKPYLLAKDVFEWFLRPKPKKPMWFEKYPK